MVGGTRSCEYEWDGSKEEGWDLRIGWICSPRWTPVRQISWVHLLRMVREVGRGHFKDSSSKYPSQHLHLEAKFGFSGGYSIWNPQSAVTMWNITRKVVCSHAPERTHSSPCSSTYYHHDAMFFFSAEYGIVLRISEDNICEAPCAWNIRNDQHT